MAIDKSIRQYYDSGMLVKPGTGRPGYGSSEAEKAWAELEEEERTGIRAPDEPGWTSDRTLNEKLDKQGVNRFELEQNIQNDFDSKFADGEIKGFYEMERAKYRMKRLQEAV